jgi:pyrroline-5-carboxylate reductase
MDSKRIGFIGAGQMAEALARGFINKNIIKASNVYATDIMEVRKEVFASFGANAADTNSEVVANSDVVFIAVKPQYVSLVLKEVRPVLTPKTVIVSIAAGVTLATLKEAAGEDSRVIRVMPNTPCLVGETASAMCLGGKADDGDADVVKQLFDAVGVIYKVDEKLLSAVTGLSGSGPAYIFVMIEALSDGGVKAGLPRDIATQLAAQTVLGSAKMVLETGKHPGVLKDMVTSPAGTTIAGVHELEKAGVRNAFINAVTGAASRADELSKM